MSNNKAAPVMVMPLDDFLTLHKRGRVVIAAVPAPSNVTTTPANSLRAVTVARTFGSSSAALRWMVGYNQIRRGPRPLYAELVCPVPKDAEQDSLPRLHPRYVAGSRVVVATRLHRFLDPLTGEVWPVFCTAAARQLEAPLPARFLARVVSSGFSASSGEPRWLCVTTLRKE